MVDNHSYHHHYSQVLAKRLRYYTHVSALLAVPLSIALLLPFHPIAWSICFGTAASPVYVLALWVVEKQRQSTSTVEYLRAKTIALHLLQLLFKGYVKTLCYYYASAALILYLNGWCFLPSLTVVSKEYRERPSLSDEWVYFWFHMFLVAALYAFQHLALQRNRLVFALGAVHVKPSATLFANVHLHFGRALVFNTATATCAPVIYTVARRAIYGVVLVLLAPFPVDTSVPPLRAGVLTLLRLAYVTFYIYLAWEFFNHVYNVYATVGCLDGKKPVSCASDDPLSTLISGLRDVAPKHQLSRLTAFQELAYVATLDSPLAARTRADIFNGHTKSSYAWPAIMDECALVITETSLRINERLKTDMDALKLSAREPEGLFGNSQGTAKTTSTSIRDYAAPASWWGSARSWADSHVAPMANRSEKLQSLETQWRQVLGAARKRYTELLASSAGLPFRVTVKRDAESRVVNPSLYANATIALAGLLASSVEEDRSYTVTSNHVSEVLNLLERPIRACANYTDVPPASVFGTSKSHVVALLHDLTMQEFFHLCVRFNFKLNDLLLSSRAFKLAKGVIDASIAQQQREAQENPVTFY